MVKGWEMELKNQINNEANKTMINYACRAFMLDEKELICNSLRIACDLIDDQFSKGEEEISSVYNSYYTLRDFTYYYLIQSGLGFLQLCSSAKSNLSTNKNIEITM